MPELPDITIYVEALARRIVARPLVRIRAASPFLVRTAHPPIQTLEGQTVAAVGRSGKRIVITFEGGAILALYLMVGGRLHWRADGAKIPARVGLAALDFAGGTLVLTEASKQKRAAIHILADEAAFAALAREGLEPIGATLAAFAERLRRENHTLKRSLTDPDLFSGIGNAYSDEILHRARLSPIRLARTLTGDEIERLWRAPSASLTEWIDRLREGAGEEFPEGVTAFREGMAVHGRFGQPCPDCGTAIQRLVYAENEANYCPTCQTGGRFLADRSLSRLLRGDWPRTIADYEARTAAARERIAATPLE
ncbi:MAG: formamidopyrimidine-DNA glycosylase [Chloroflexi bacterium]|nr:formamidopyrimidine-DNA glycosylase [Chloroflexota bacterium]